jgi:peptide/nickel transport system substrate-binding protein
MENRFGVKDFFVFVLLVAVIALLVLAMVQFDRQFKEVQAIKKQNNDLTRDLVAIQRQLARGVVATGAGGGAAGVAPESMPLFAPLVKAERMPGFERGDWLVDNFGTKIGRLTPYIATDLYQQWVESRVMEGLATRDPDTLKFIPQLAEGWEISKDGLTFTFKLRQGVTFSDGSPFSSDDVVFTFDWLRNTEVNAPRVRAYFDKLKEVRANGPNEVVISFTEPYFMSFETVASDVRILSKQFYSRFTPQQYNERTGLLIGTGPYKLTDAENWSPGKPVELVRNERYWGVPPTFDRLIFREVEDESAEMVMFGNGELDIFACQPEQYEKLLKDERVVKMSQHLKYPSPLNGYSYIGWNQQRRQADGKLAPTPFADVRVRTAMSLMTDRERIAKEVFLGYGSVASGPFDPNGPQAAPDVKPLPFDEQKAKQLLAEAGYTDRNGDGTIDGPDGQPFRFKLSYPSASATYQRVVLFLKDSFARAGVTMEPDPVDWPVLLDRIKRGQYDACSLAWGGTVESDPYQIFHSSQISDQGDNRTHYVNKKLDEVIERARKTVNDDERAKLWHEVHRILHADQPYTFLFNRPSLVFINGRIANVGTSKLGLNYVRLNTTTVPWFVPKAQQRYTQ